LKLSKALLNFSSGHYSTFAHSPPNFRKSS